MTRIASRWTSGARLDLLVSPGFLAALALLAVNDHALKRAYPGLVTGKLSDFAGLVAFTIFLAVLRPTPTRAIGIAVAIMFAWWKSPLSQFAIDAANAVLPHKVGRVVDLSDLVALLALPVAVVFVIDRPRRIHRSSTVLAVMAASAFIFAGSTSISLGNLGSNETIYRIPPEDPSAAYVLSFPSRELAQRFDDTGLFHGADVGGGFFLPNAVSGEHGVTLDDCSRAVVKVIPVDTATVLRLDRLAVKKIDRCDASTEPILRGLFTSEVIERLQGRRAARSPVVGDRKLFDYPVDDAPSLMLRGSLADAVQRLGSRAVLAHEYHDGVYQLGTVACRGRFRMTESSDRSSVMVTGVGYDLPCYKGASQACLAQLFQMFIAEPQDPPPTPSAVATPRACPDSLAGGARILATWFAPTRAVAIPTPFAGTPVPPSPPNDDPGAIPLLPFAPPTR